MILLFALNIAAGLLIVASAAYSLKLAWHPTRCQHKGCKSEGLRCTVGYGTEEHEAWYCWDHASDYGFCRVCGSFWGGIESFEFGAHPGICEFCWDEIHDDFDACYYRDEYDCDFGDDDLGYWDFNHYDEAGYPMQAAPIWDGAGLDDDALPF